GRPARPARRGRASTPPRARAAPRPPPPSPPPDHSPARKEASVPVLDSRTRPAEAEPRPVAAADGQAAPVTMTRDPEARLAALFDPGTVRLLTPHDDSGAVAASGQIGGTLAVGFASDPKMQGGAMGSAGCAAIVAAYEEAVAPGPPVIGP